MLSIHKLTPAHLDYFFELAAEGNYYFKNGERRPFYLGSGAFRMGRRGISIKAEAAKLFAGFDPTTGEPLVQNAGSEGRVPAWDLTFNAPKSVTLSGVGGPKALCAAVPEHHQAAIEAAMKFAERTMAFCRTGKGGRDLVRCGLVGICCEHMTSRGVLDERTKRVHYDCHLHTHLLLCNAGVDATGKTRALLSLPFYYHKKLLGAYYRAHLAHLLEANHGLRSERHGESFELIGFHVRVLEYFSARRQQILDEMKRLGQSGAVAAAKATLTTRRTKGDVPPRDELITEWRRELLALDFAEKQILKLMHQPQRDTEKSIPELITRALANLSQQVSHFTGTKLLYEVLCEAPTLGVAPAALPDAVQKALQTHKDIVSLKEMDGEMRYSTTAILEEEQKLLTEVERLRIEKRRIMSERAAKKFLARRSWLSPDQYAALLSLLTGRESLQVVDGWAGTGKTSMMKVFVDACRKVGRPVIFAAPTGKAVRVLKQATGAPAYTLHVLLGEYEHATRRKVRHHAKQFKRAVKGKRTYRQEQPGPMSFDKNTIVIVDEASMVPRKRMLTLLRLVRQRGAECVLQGDHEQLPPVEPGAPYSSICGRIEHSKLRDIKRQDDAWAREASRLFAEGQPGLGLKTYAERGCVLVRDNANKALDALVDDHSKLFGASPEKGLVIAYTNAQVDSINIECQRKRLMAGYLSREASEIVDKDSNSGRVTRNRVHVGDRIVCTRNNSRLGVENGAFGTVTAISPLHSSISVRLDDGRRVVVPTRKYKHLRLGYASTVYRSQGATVENVLVLTTGAGGMQNSHAAYVAATRATAKTMFYTDKELVGDLLENIEDSLLAQEMARKPDLSTATDLLEQAEKESTTASHVHAESADSDPGVEAMKRLLRRGSAQSEVERKKKEKANTSLLEGARIRFSRPIESLDVRQDDIATVMAVDVEKQTLRAALAGQRIVTVPLAEQFVVHAASQVQSEEVVQSATANNEQADEAVQAQETPSPALQSLFPEDVYTSLQNEVAVASSQMAQVFESSTLSLTQGYSDLATQQAAAQQQLFTGAAQTHADNQNQTISTQYMRNQL